MLAAAEPADISLVVTPEPQVVVLVVAVEALKQSTLAVALAVTTEAVAAVAVLLDQQLVVPVVKVF